MKEPGTSQAQRIQEIGVGRWLDEPMDLDEFYGKPGPGLLESLKAWLRKKFNWGKP